MNFLHSYTPIYIDTHKIGSSSSVPVLYCAERRLNLGVLVLCL
jgi:hypothetical protein